MIATIALTTTALAVLALTLIHQPWKPPPTPTHPCGHEGGGWGGEVRINKDHTLTPITTCTICRRTWHHTPKDNS